MDASAAAADGSVDSEGAERDYTPAVYGSLLVTTMIAVQWRADTTAIFVGLSLVISVTVFWLTHVWAGIVNWRLHGSLRRADVLAIGVREAPMLGALVVPMGFFGVAALLDAPVELVIDVGLAISVAQLFLWGLAVGRAAHRSWVLALVIAAVDCALGFAVVALKVVILH